MPPFNAVRRDRLADAAIEVLAREGARGLTHRAVDAEAGEPSGTTSRYFRTRDALMRGVVERIAALHFADLERAPRGPVDEDTLAGHLASLVHDGITRHRTRQIAVTELFLESTRRPDLHTLMAETRAAQIQLMRRIHAAAGVTLSTHEAAMLVTAIMGLITVALTTPEAIGMHSPDDVRELALETINRVRGTAADIRSERPA
ncbi:MAG TPA: TetR/AcrR family transcriptional regulator [Pilimelia sp.]|nr:TetR/AcrR family transcriptional regulator [Pilimelia sp.]